MAFNIHVLGTQGYRFTQENCPDQDIFQAASAIGKIKTAGRIAQGSGGSGGSNRMNGVQAIAQIQGFHLLAQGLSLLALTTNSSRAKIHFNLRTERTAWPDSGTTIQFNYSTNHADLHARFGRQVFPALQEFDMNNYGVALKMGAAISAYSAAVRNENPMLVINIRNFSFL